MIDIKILRNDPEKVKANCKRRGAEVDVDAIYAKDQEWLTLTREVEEMRAERNRLSAECKTNPEAREIVKGMKGELQLKEARLKEVAAEVDELLSWLPNWLSEDTPDGASDEDNSEFKTWGEHPTFSFTPCAHDELGELLGIIDTTRGAKVAQAGFYYWRGKGAQLAQALFFWTQQQLVQRGFTLFMSPCAAKGQTLFGTGYLPFFADQTYNLEGQDLALIGTSEQTLVAYHGDEILVGDTLPRKYTAFTPCFRTEAGSYGKESRGIFRVHQFHKVEQIIFSTPEESPKYHEFCQENIEYLFQTLGIPYRVVNVCVGDMGAPGYKKYDVEGWFPGYGGYRELTSNTNLLDFQSRRLKIRYADADNKKEFVHTISSTAVTDRAVCAILENFQQEDGTVIIPEALRPLCGFDKIEPEGK